jgi:hypothetical protein
MTETLKDPDAGTYDITTIYRDPRKGVPLDGGKERVYVFSFPDPQEAKKWAENLGIPKRCWEEEKRRVRVQEPFVSRALQLPKAPKDLIEKILQEQAPKSV